MGWLASEMHLNFCFVFTSEFWHELMNRCGIKLKRSTVNQPETQGFAMAANRVMIHTLKPYLADVYEPWHEQVVPAKLAHDSGIQTNLCCTSLEAL